MLKTTFLLALTVESRKPVSAGRLKMVLKYSTAREAIETGLQGAKAEAITVRFSPPMIGMVQKVAEEV